MYHAVDEGLFVSAEDGDERRFLCVTASHGRVEVHHIGVVVIVADVVVLPPARVGSTIRS